MRGDRDTSDSHEEHRECCPRVDWGDFSQAHKLTSVPLRPSLVNGVDQYSFKPHLLSKANWLLGVFIFKAVVLARPQKCSSVYLLGNHELIPKCYVMRCEVQSQALEHRQTEHHSHCVNLVIGKSQGSGQRSLRRTSKPPQRTRQCSTERPMALDNFWWTRTRLVPTPARLRNYTSTLLWP